MPRPLWRDVDESGTDPRWRCQRCRQRHRPGTVCPPVGVWLVAAFCRRGCRADGFTYFYCKHHWTKGS